MFSINTLLYQVGLLKNKEIARSFGIPRSPLWPKTRDNWLKLSPFCKFCERTTKLTVHHKKPFHLFPELELDPRNLITVCEWPTMNCHLWWCHGGDWSCYVRDIDDFAKRVLQFNRVDRLRNRSC